MTRFWINVKGSARMQKGPQSGSCGPFAVPSAGNSREQARTGDREPQRFRGCSRVFPPVLGQRTYRGERFRLALLSHISAFCGPFAVQIPGASQPVPRRSAFRRGRRLSPKRAIRCNRA